MRIRVTSEHLEDTGPMPSSWSYITPDEYMGLLTLPKEELPGHEMVYVLVDEEDFPMAQLPHPMELLCKRWESKLEYFKSDGEPHEKRKLTEAEIEKAKAIEERRHNNNDVEEISFDFEL